MDIATQLILSEWKGLKKLFIRFKLTVEETKSKQDS